MSTSKLRSQHDRYVVSNVGFGYAVHDRGKRVQNPNTDPNKGPARSRNVRNAPVVEVCSTRETALALAAELNARARAEEGK